MTLKNSARDGRLHFDHRLQPPHRGARSERPAAQGLPQRRHRGRGGAQGRPDLPASPERMSENSPVRDNVENFKNWETRFFGPFRLYIIYIIHNTETYRDMYNIIFHIFLLSTPQARAPGRGGGRSARPGHGRRVHGQAQGCQATGRHRRSG